MHIPALLPDELLGGYLARLAHLNALTSGAAALDALYDDPNRPRSSGGCASPFELIARVTGVDKGHLLRAHSLAPLALAVRPGRDPIRHEDPRALPLKRRWREDAVAPAKWRCPRCVNEDMGFWGFAYARRSAQLPGIDWCTKHGVALQRATAPLDEGAAAPVVLSPAEVRYAEIMDAILDLSQSIPLTQTSIRLRHRMQQLGLRTRRDSSGSTTSGLVVSVLPRRWLERHRPHVLNGGGSADLDNIHTSPLRPFATQDYVLALTALYATADAALADFLRPLDTAERFRLDDLVRRRRGKQDAPTRISAQLAEDLREAARQ
jgi:hypothetical protein